MAGLELHNVDCWRHRRVILDGLSLRAPSGKITALLGDDESGRMTTLKVIAGIEKLQGGEILIEGEDVTRESAKLRSAATVFSSAALMPHKSAFENIAYPLRIARFDQATVEARVLAVGDHFGLTDVLTQRPKKLSAVQCYQIGLARALVRDPAVYLFELPSEEEAEAEVRELAIAEMQRLRDEFGRTVVYAAGTVEDVRDLADWVVVLHEGRRLQMGSLQKLVDRPSTRRVARLLGAKLRSARVTAADAGEVRLRLKDGTRLALPCESDEVARGQRASLGIWPEHMGQSGDEAAYPPEHCYLFNERGRLVAGPAGAAPRRKGKGASSRR